ISANSSARSHPTRSKVLDAVLLSAPLGRRGEGLRLGSVERRDRAEEARFTVEYGGWRRVAHNPVFGLDLDPPELRMARQPVHLVDLGEGDIGGDQPLDQRAAG